MTLNKIIFGLSFYLIMGSSVFSQQQEEIGNFRFDKTERTVSWVNVFEPEQDIDFNSLKTYFSENGIINIISEDSSSFKGEFEKRPIDNQKYGYSRGRTPMVLIDVEQIFDVSIEFKEGRYRAILTNLGYIDDGVMSDLINRSLVGQTSTTSKGNIESYNGDFSFKKNNKVRNNLSSILELLDKFYIDMLTFKTVQNLDEDW